MRIPVLLSILSFIFILGCDGERNLDEKKRIEKIDPARAKENAEIKLCRDFEPGGFVDHTTIPKVSFLKNKVLKFNYHSLCERDPDEKDYCRLICDYQSFKAVLKDNQIIKKSFKKYDTEIDMKCERYSDETCTNYFVSLKLSNSGKEVFQQNTGFKKLGTYTVSGRLGDIDLKTATGEMWQVHILGYYKHVYFIAPKTPGYFQNIYNIQFLRDYATTTLPILGNINLSLPMKMKNGDVLDLNSFGFVSRLKTPILTELNFKRSVKVIDSKKTYPLEISLEMNFE